MTNTSKITEAAPALYSALAALVENHAGLGVSPAMLNAMAALRLAGWKSPDERFEEAITAIREAIEA